MSDGTMAGMSVTRRHRNLLLAASLVTYLLITLGGIVCVTDASRGCPDWPGCYGRIVPPMRVDSILEYSHRVLAALAFLLVAASAINGWLHYRSIRWLSRPPIAAVALLLLVAALGAIGVEDGLSPGLAALDLGSALLVLALVVAATVMAVIRYRHPNLPDHLEFKSRSARLVLWSLAAVFLVLVSAVLVARSGSVVRCMSWPLVGGGPLVGSGQQLGAGVGWGHLVRQLLAASATIMAVAVLVMTWRQAARQSARRVVSAVTGALLLAELVLGAALSAFGYNLALQLAFSVTAAALWTSLVVLVVLVGLPALDAATGSKADKMG